jgi:hypothetical protein
VGIQVLYVISAEEVIGLSGVKGKDAHIAEIQRVLDLGLSYR